MFDKLEKLKKVIANKYKQEKSNLQKMIIPSQKGRLGKK